MLYFQLGPGLFSGAFAASFREGPSIFFDCFTNNRIQFSYPANVIYSLTLVREIPFNATIPMQGIASSLFSEKSRKSNNGHSRNFHGEYLEY